MNFNFTPSPSFVKKGFEEYEGEFSAYERNELSLLRQSYPELKHWGDFAINLAWSDFSQSTYLVPWVDFGSGNRDELFLNFCYWIQCKGSWPFGNDIEKLAKVDGWKLS